MYAIIETGGKQYKVREGDTVAIEKIASDVGTECVFDKVLAIGEGDDAEFGAPYVAGAKVTASVVGNGKAKKVIIYKFKSKKGYHKKKGHRQPFTSVKIESIAK